MRSIEEIKQEITAEYIKHPAVAARYGLEKGKTFEEQFSKLSVESLLFYTVATAIYSIEWIRNTFLKDVETAKKETLVGNQMWYRAQCLRFKQGKTIEWDPERSSWKYTDEQTAVNGTGEKAASSPIVKECAVTVSEGVVLIKATKDKDGKRAPLDKNEVDGLKAFLDKVKIAGTTVKIISKEADVLHCEMTVYYNAMTQSLEDIKEHVEAASKQYMEQLPFGGIYDINKHMQAIMTVTGVESIKPVNVYQDGALERDKLVVDGRILKSFYTMETGYIDTDKKSQIIFTYEGTRLL